MNFISFLFNYFFVELECYRMIFVSFHAKVDSSWLDR